MSKRIHGVAWSLLVALCAGACGTRTPGDPTDGGATGIDGETRERDGQTPLPATCQCEHQWDRRLSGEAAGSVSISSTGDVVVSRSEFSAVDLAYRGTLARFDRDGSLTWERQPRTATVPFDADLPSFTGDMDGNIFAFVRYEEGQDIGGGPRERGYGIARFAPDGSLDWDRYLGLSMSDLAVVMGPSGHIVTIGEFFDTANFGGGPHTIPFPDPRGVFIAVYTPDGDLVWDRVFQRREHLLGISSVAVDEAGAVIAVGGFTGTIDFGGGMRTSAGSDGASGAFIVTFDELGNYLWDRTYGRSVAVGAAVGAEGELAVVGRFSQSIDFGGGTRVTTGSGYNGFVLRLDRFGQYRWDNSTLEFPSSFGGPTAVAFDGIANVVIAGSFNERANLGGEDQASAAGNEPVMFVARYHGTDGAFGWDRTYYGHHPLMQVRDIEFAPDDTRLVLTGVFSGQVDLGGGASTSTGESDTFLLSMNCGCAEP